MEKQIDCGLVFDLGGGEAMLILHYAGETRLDMVVANRVDPAVTEPPTSRNMTMADQQATYIVPVDKVQRLQDALELTLRPMIECECGDSEVTLLRKQIAASHDAAERAAFIVARMIDGCPF